MESFPSVVVVERLAQLELQVGSLRQENRALVERIDLAAMSARSWRKAAVFLTLAGAFTALAGRAFVAGTPKIVEAERFSLRDRDGKRRAILDVTTEGCPILAFYDQSDNNVLQIIAWHDGTAGMNIFDTTGRARLTIGGGKGNAMGLSVFETNGQKRIEVGVSKSGDAGLAIYDREGKSLLPKNKDRKE